MVLFKNRKNDQAMRAESENFCDFVIQAKTRANPQNIFVMAPVTNLISVCNFCKRKLALQNFCNTLFLITKWKGIENITISRN